MNLCTSPARAFVAAILSVAISLHAVPCASADVAEITVFVANGAAYHGALVERVPGSHLTIKLATGEIRRIEWSEIASDTMSSPPPSAPAAPPVSAPAAPSTSAAPPSGPVVSVTANKAGVALERMKLGAYEGPSYTRLCVAPCTMKVEAGAGYRLAGPGLRATKTFSLDGDNRTVDGKMGSTTNFVLGAIFTPIGLGLGVTGVVTYASAAQDGSTDVPVGLLVAGGATLLVGFGLLLSGTSSATIDGKKASATAKVRVDVGGVHF